MTLIEGISNEALLLSGIAAGAIIGGYVICVSKTVSHGSQFVATGGHTMTHRKKREIVSGLMSVMTSVHKFLLVFGLVWASVGSIWTVCHFSALGLPSFLLFMPVIFDVVGFLLIYHAVKSVIKNKHLLENGIEVIGIITQSYLDRSYSQNGQPCTRIIYNYTHPAFPLHNNAPRTGEIQTFNHNIINQFTVGTQLVIFIDPFDPDSSVAPGLLGVVVRNLPH